MKDQAVSIMKKNAFFIVMLLILLVMQVFDIIYTYKGIMAGCTEGATIAKLFMRKFGLLKGMIILKLTALPVIIFLYLDYIYSKRFFNRFFLKISILGCILFYMDILTRWRIQIALRCG